MNNIELSDYLGKPIFLHAVNRELHDAVGKPINSSGLIHVIRGFSILSCQPVFCNVSQIHEVFYDNPNSLEEITELTKIGRLIPHSDYGSHKEFIESRQEKFSHSKVKHPSFFKKQNKNLIDLQHSTMGKSASTTNYIESNLFNWIDDADSTLENTLSQNDKKTLRKSEDLIISTLKERDKRALTIDLFEKTAKKKYSKATEGAIRRALTESYISSYIDSYDPRCIWGFVGLNHFEKMALLTGLHIKFGDAILSKTGIHQYLNQMDNYGQVERLLLDQTPEFANFRNSYAELALEFDKLSDVNNPWHTRNSEVSSSINKLLRSDQLKPNQQGSNLKDCLLYASDSLANTRRFLFPDTEISSNRFSQALSQETTESAEPRISTMNSDETVIDTHSKMNSFFGSFYLLVVYSGIAGAIILFSILQFYSDFTNTQILIISAIGALVISFVTFWFHPTNFYRRISYIGLIASALGGYNLSVTVPDFLNSKGSLLEISNTSSAFLIFSGIIVFVTSIIADVFTRTKNNM